MKIGVRLRSGTQSPVSLAHVVLDAERADLDFVHLADDPRLPIDGVNHASSTWPSLGAISVATLFVHVQIDGIPITGPLHPAAVAHLATSAGALLRGRFTVGFSAGSCDAVTGRARLARPVRLRALAEGIDVFRRLAAGERVDQQDGGLVVNDFRLPGGLAKVPPVSITATEETEAALAAELGCHLVVPLGADVAGVIDAYRRAGGSGDVAAPLLLADPDEPTSLATARIMLTDRAALDDRRSRAEDADLTDADDDVTPDWVDPTQPDEMTSAVRGLAELGVVRIELMSPSRDPHLAIRQWRTYRELIDLPVRRPGDVAEPPAPIDLAEPVVAPPPPESQREVAAVVEVAAAPAPAPAPVPAPVATPEPDLDIVAADASGTAPEPEPEAQPETNVDESPQEAPVKSGLRDALEVALADDEPPNETVLEFSDALES